MAPRSRGLERSLVSLGPSSVSRSMCRSCRQSFAQRRPASTATAQATVEAPPISQLTPNEPTSLPVELPAYKVKAGVLLSRPPLVTPEAHPFEKAFHLYQRRLNERLVLPFTQYFYYKKGTPAFEHWRKNKAARLGTATRDIGQYNAYKEDSWNDEVLVGDNTGSQQSVVEKLVEEEGRGEEFSADSGLTKTAGLRRVTDADEKNDQRSLERSLSRTLYLLVKEKASGGKTANWILPSGVLREKEGIAEAAKRVLDETCGVDMNTWQVARHPVGHYNVDYATLEASREGREASQQVQPVQESAKEVGEKTFFIKTRIFAGQANLAQGVQAWDDYAWLASDEIEGKVHPRYWARIKNMLAEQ